MEHPYETIARITCDQIGGHIAKDANDSNIAALMHLSSSLSLKNLFTNWKNIEYILGANFYSVLVRDLIDRICETVVTGVHDGFESTKGMVGIWSFNTLYSIAKNLIRVVNVTDTKRIALVSAPLPNEVTEADLANVVHMYTDEFTELSFYAVIAHAQSVIVTTTTDHMSNMLPTILMYSKQVPLEYRLTSGFITTAKPVLDEIKAEAPNMAAPEKYNSGKAAKYSEAMLKIFTMMIPTYVGGSGLGPEVVTDVLELSSLASKYEQPPKNGSLYDTKIHFQVVPAKTNMVPPVIANVDMTLGDVLKVVYGSERVSKGVIDRFGKKLRGFIMNLTGYIITVQLYKIRRELEGQSYLADWVKSDTPDVHAGECSD